jgi:predicted nucleic acid-binding protein
MSGVELCFFDTNVLLYLVSSDTAKADKAEALLAKGGIVSVQVLNEFASVAGRKQKLLLPEIRDALSTIRALCEVVPVSLETHDTALDLAERFGFSIYDALIVAAAQLAKCIWLYTEDMQHGQVISGLTISDPFRGL